MDLGAVDLLHIGSACLMSRYFVFHPNFDILFALFGSSFCFILLENSIAAVEPTVGFRTFLLSNRF